MASVPAAFGWRIGVDGWGVSFLTIFLSMIAGLVLYFTLGCAVLRAVVPEYSARLRLGESGHAGEVAIMTAVCDLGAHMGVLVSYGTSPLRVALVVVSAVFFIYPVYFLVTTLWTLQPEVRAALAGKQRLNTVYFANARRKIASWSEYMPVTISLAVYTEANEVIFSTIRDCLAAVAEYQRVTGRQANLLVSDDGIAKFLNAPLSAATLAGATGAAAERLDFYRRHGIAFVARPLAGRRGKFKKAGNLNYTYGLARHLAQGITLDHLTGPGGAYEGGWAEGRIVVHELICLLDKDSGLAPGVLTATAPEFAADPKLAFTQHVTGASNPDENYFTWLQARFTSAIYGIALASKALQGLQVHIMGHSAFLRRSFLEETGDWPEDRVSEDYAKALEAYQANWHGKFIAFPGLAFTEQVTASFGEETDKQQRYCYGMTELTQDRRPYLPLPMRADLMIHHFSYINLAAALPVVLLLLATHQIYYLFAGMLVNGLIFLVLPVVQGCLLSSVLGLRGLSDAVRFFALNGLAFVGHSYAMLTGHWIFFSDAYRGTYEPFPATSVDRVEHSVAAGWALLKGYARKNAPAVAAYFLVVLGCLSVLQDQPPHIVRPFVVAFVIGHAVAPIALTPQLFAWSRQLSQASLARRWNVLRSKVAESRRSIP
ncbi:MAG: glycosyltransferase [Bifidobacteriaceae bacterium]|nr:glycosyltransferase [Bifidobacteriaceae bacterium]